MTMACFLVGMYIRVIAEELERQLPHLTVKTGLHNAVIEMHTKKPSFLDKSQWKEGKTFIVPARQSACDACRTQ